MKVRWKTGTRMSVPASTAHDFFEKIRQDNNGELDLDDAERKSRPKNSPLHNLLEWDDAKCGVAHRKTQLRFIVQKLEVIHDGMTTAVRAYESIQVEVTSPNKPVEKKHVFMRTEDILADPAGREALLAKAITDIMTFKRRYACLSELAVVIQTMDAVAKKLAG